MAGHRGEYALVSPNEEAYSEDIRNGKSRTTLSRNLQIIRNKRRIVLLVGCSILVFFTFLLHQSTLLSIAPCESSQQLNPSHLDYLATPYPDHKYSNVDNETAYIVGEHHAVSGEYPEDYEWIDPYTRDSFVEIMYTNGMNNNAMGRMPAGSKYDMLVIARGRNDKYMDPTENIPYVNLTIVGFFANYNPEKGTWERAGPEPYVLELPVWRQFPRPCLNLVNGGAADPRFLWSDAGEPLAVIGTSSRVAGVCKAVGMVDLRAVWPALKEHLEEIGYGEIPIKFDTFTEVGKASKKEQFEKNWAAFFSGPKPVTKTLPWYKILFGGWQTKLADSTWPYFASQISPRSVLKVDPTLDTSHRSADSYVLSKEIDLTMTANGTSIMADSQCLIDSLPHTWNTHSLHQATPFYRVTFCARGTCEPSHENTVLLGLVHYKKSRRSYRRMFVTMSTEAPFQVLSVSPPLHFGSVEIDDDVVFSVSMAFLPTKNAVEQVEGESPFKESLDTPGGYLGHGWLDDTLIVGAGLRDEVYDSIHLPVSDALRSHTLCTK